MTDFTESEIRAYYTSRILDLKWANRRELRCGCPVHSGTDPNFSINTLTGLARCHSQCGRGWDMISLEQEIRGCDFPTAKSEVFKIVGRPEPSWEERNFRATYDYCDEGGTLRYQVVRMAPTDKDPKPFRQRRPDGGGWQWGLGSVSPLPYRLQHWKESPSIGVVEGEKDVHTLERIGIPATTNSGGATNFRPELAPYFTGKRVVILPDNDEKGRSHAMQVAAILSPVAASLKIVELPNLPLKGDVTDFVNDGGTKEQILDLIKRAQFWTPEFQFGETVPDENDKYVRTLAQVMDECGGFDQFWNLVEQEGVPTPWQRLTEDLGGGMRKGEVYVIGANQGSGKTSLALQFIIAALRHGAGVLMFSMEMGWKDVFQRMLGIEARIDIREYRLAQKRREDTSAYRKALQEPWVTELIGKPLIVSRKSAVTPDYIVEESARLKRKHKIDLIVVDHMQLMAATGSVKGDYEKFTAISRANKQTAVTVDVPLLVVSQTNRSNSATGRTSDLEVSDLRGSGAIEEDAAGVMLLYPDKQDKELALACGTYPVGPVKTWLKLGKARYGIQDSSVPLLHFKTITRFDLFNGPMPTADGGSEE
jgi:replicative DNA helicase